VDEHAHSINNSDFAVIMDESLVGDWPTSRHAGAAGIMFADGHAELHRWQDDLIKVPDDQPIDWNVAFDHSPDIDWMRERASVPR
jgi:prepilin-type processing-associated H-X9-DG protein